jgi:antiviral helicase SKI2
VITGDVSINPEASCLILTTEILRSMLYKGADLIRDVEWVIFDEVHYLNDLERGVVWEEVIILLPAHVKIVMLSATVPNTLEFADWVGRTKRKHIFVMGTEKRPVPLQHFLWCRQKLFQIMDGTTGRFLPEGFKAAKAEGQTEKTKALAKRGIFKKPSLRQTKSSWVVLINYLKANLLLPVVIFAFSKRVCEDCAYSMYNMDLTTSAEKSEITILVSQALARLAVVDRRLPQVLRVRDLVRRGVGVHHAGMLPILKVCMQLSHSGRDSDQSMSHCIYVLSR